MFDLDNVFPLNFLVKDSRSCSLGELIPLSLKENSFNFQFFLLS